MDDQTPILAVDFDGTLCEHKFPAIGEMNKPLFEAVLNAKKAGWKVILWTCRGGNYLEAAVNWCKAHGLEFEAVNDDIPEIKDSDFGRDKSGKIYATYYIDDRNIDISSFIESME